MKLHQAFEISRGEVVSFIGAGGKTSTLVGLGYELVEKQWRVLATTSTRMSVDQLSLFPYAMPYDADAQSISEALTEHQFVFLYESIRKGIVYGPDVDWTPQLLDSVDSDVLLVEADIADGLPFKAPYQDEPNIPLETSLVIPIASLSVLGQPLNSEHVYNPEAMSAKYGFLADTRVKSPWVAQVLRDDDLGLYGVPDKARVVAFLNQTPERGYLRGRARLIARLALQTNRLYGVALGTVRGANPVHEVQRGVGAIVLAGGASTRMGEPKVLLPWEGRKTIIEHILEQLIRAKIDHIYVVTGHYAEAVKQVVKPLGVKVVHNRSFKTGEMLSSLKAGLRAMPNHIAASMIVLGDQPRIESRVIYEILSAYSGGAGDIVAPRYQQRRGHPILIARRFWGEILNLGRKSAPRDVINAHESEIAYINVDTDSVIHDIDTPADYRTARKRAGLTDRPHPRKSLKSDLG